MTLSLRLPLFWLGSWLRAPPEGQAGFPFLSPTSGGRFSSSVFTRLMKWFLTRADASSFCVRHQGGRARVCAQLMTHSRPPPLNWAQSPPAKWSP